ncbi:MAG TPA: AAA family ATPase [Terracidiphilus sp.]|jgi:type II secretory pathway predicted ATPase ExeA
MYKKFFGLRDLPFACSPDPRFLYVVPEIQEALACLQYGIAARKGFVVLTGEVGTGKTTIVKAVLDSLAKDRVCTAFVFNPRLNVLDFLEFVLSDFGIRVASRTKAGMLMQLNSWLIERYRDRMLCTIVVDEAQNLSWELLEEIRLLTNLETKTDKLLQIVLAGQPELEQKLLQPRLRQLRQRIALWSKTRSLTSEETHAYIDQRLKVAGATEQLFPDDSAEAVFRCSQGVPRLINLICEHALISAYVDHVKPIPAAIIEAVGADLDLEGKSVCESGGNRQLVSKPSGPVALKKIKEISNGVHGPIEVEI